MRGVAFALKEKSPESRPHNYHTLENSCPGSDDSVVTLSRFAMVMVVFFSERGRLGKVMNDASW